MLAIMPPPELTKDIEQIRFEFADKYNCKAALKPPVHITLIPPYKTLPDSEEKIVPVMEQWAVTQIPFPVTLQNYSAFKNNGVVFIDVLSNDLLQSFQRELRGKFLEVLPMPEVKRFTSFHPHLTIGYRDIPKDVFKQAAEEYTARSFFATFIVDRFYLWRHDGKQWQVLHSFAMGNISVGERFRESFD
jgi:2'-5' RNA ligase